MNLSRKAKVLVVTLWVGAGLLFVGLDPAAADCVATPDTPECIATTAGGSLKTTYIAIVVALVPLAVTVFLVGRAWFKARKMVKL